MRSTVTSAGARLRNSRMRRLALYSCDLEFPTEQSIIWAISSWSYPSTSCNRKMVLQPAGKSLMARASVMRSTVLASLLSRPPGSRCSGVEFWLDESWFNMSSNETCFRAFLRKCN